MRGRERERERGGGELGKGRWLRERERGGEMGPGFISLVRRGTTHGRGMMAGGGDHVPGENVGWGWGFLSGEILGPGNRTKTMAYSLLSRRAGHTHR